MVPLIWRQKGNRLIYKKNLGIILYYSGIRFDTKSAYGPLYFMLQNHIFGLSSDRKDGIKC